MTARGFRAMAATLLSEQGWASEIIEKQLAHADRNQVRAAYQRSELLAERRKMMQTWAEFLDFLKDAERHPGEQAIMPHEVVKLATLGGMSMIRA
ncbi:MAG: hypothetical protein FWF99_02840 [Desulfovibrionaceae bacterium]|nr:hypothetical protein [Desulfovibrionaceae bacterium]